MKHIDFEKLDMMSLLIIVNLCENKSATQVSKILNIPQPKISRSLRNVRSIFGNELFQRKKYGLIPNDYAKSIYPIAKEIVEQAQRFNHIGQQNKGQERWFEVAIPGLISYIYPKALMHSVKNDHKHFHLNFSPWNASTLQSIMDGEITLGICCGNHQEAQSLVQKNFEVEYVKSLSELFLVCSSNHPLLQQEITLERIAEYPFVKTDVGCNPRSTSPFEDYCHSNGIPLNVDICISSVSSLFLYLQESQAVALVPYHSVFELLPDVPMIHGVRIADVETDKLFKVSSPRTVEMICSTDSSDEDLNWLKQQIREVTSTLV
ncbi:LysR family transcriptional regulator [Shewanella sp. C32]|uniref:LysR family transcriptional regulator n=1 Tax=Shewanella electrica TaxID=515560 RepID=A0ABT2FN61_9GAMM|nr:LysR family transcriptional regulator [Shewanella electrica]MCH1926254.1 LysR family transcriptional regulator [Shewanella electrica]MCS4557778.1 LysR family transcriptional regulator [Shewanella electrica]